MPLHEVGYRPWKGRLRGSLSAIAVIASTGIRLAWASRWLRRAVFFAWSPALVFAGSFFAFEQAVDEGRLGSMRDRASVGRNVDGVGILGKIIADSLGSIDPSASKHDDPEVEIVRTRRAVWSRLLLAFMRSPQAILLAIVVGLVAPALVSRDLRAKAWLIYFTRPVGKFEYETGKLLILALLVATITMLPALALWLMGVAVSPSVWVAVTTWDLPLRIVAASVALALPTVLMALAFSSLTTADMMRAASDEAAVQAGSGMGVGEGTRSAQRPRGPRRGPRNGLTDILEPIARPDAPPFDIRRIGWLSRATGLDASIDRWAWLSPYHALGVVQAWIFGIERRPAAILPPVISLTCVTLLSAIVLWWRVDAPARA